MPGGRSSGASSRASSRRAKRAAQRAKTIFGVPERFERPRLVLCVAVFALVAFGLLMIYSASSIIALTSEAYGNNPAYFLQRQLIFAAVGIGLAALLASQDYHLWCGGLLSVAWIVTTLLLGLVMFTSSGSDAYGATRWIQIAGFTLQPSEFAKLTVVLTVANLCQRYFEEATLDWKHFCRLMFVGVVIPLALVLLQPDKGTTLICVATLLVMLYLSGVPSRFIGLIIVVGLALFFAYAMHDEYSRQRILTMLDPWADPYGTGYQLIQGFYAFGSGGLLGVGIGSGRQKYSYLPMAYNDFIYAVIGEECGLIGSLGVLVGFAAILWAGFRIARYAPDLSGRLIAAGSVSMLVIQLFVNICGVLGIIPLTGKPIPFLSYGGSSIISCLMLVGLTVSVSRSSHLTETDYDRRRSDISLAFRAHPRQDVDGLGPVGEPTPRSASLERDGFKRHDRNLRVVGSSSTPLVRRDLTGEQRASSLASRARITIDAHGRKRIDLGPDAAERLRPHEKASSRNYGERSEGKRRRGR
jgi:cell division protein FtsW